MGKKEDSKLDDKMLFEIGEYARDRDEMGIAKNYYILTACDGDADAQNNLAVIYEREGKDDKAFLWYKKAADSGLAIAWVNLGKCYECGRGTAIDYKQASLCYMRAMEEKFDGGYENLGELYFRGLLGKKDVSKAFQIWLDGAFNATNGGCASSFQAGFAYDSGFGVKASLEKAIYLYERCINAKDDPGDYKRVAHYNLGQIYLYRDESIKDVNKAIEHYLASAKLDYPNAMYALGEYFFQGREDEKKEYIAKYWLFEATKYDHIKSMLLLSRIWLSDMKNMGGAATKLLLHFLEIVKKDDTECLEEFEELKKDFPDKEFWENFEVASKEFFEANKKATA